MTPDVRVLDASDLRAAHTLFSGAMHRPPADDAGWELARDNFSSAGRTLGVVEGSTPIGTATSFPTRTAVPGGAALDTAGVTRVAVRADRTRQGLLSALMRAQLQDLAERGEPLASLRSTEARIYGRYGYGVATRGRRITVRTDGSGWREGAPHGGEVRLIAPADAVSVLGAVHERLALRRTGGITRRPEWWSFRLGHRIAAREPFVVAVHTGPDGDDGFAVATPVAAERVTGRTLTVVDLHAADAAATAGLWRFLLGLDLVVRLQARHRPLDEPLELLLADPRDCTVVEVGDETWLRLVDVPAALAARSWGAGPSVLLAVHDRLLGRNDGVYRIGDGTAERVGALGTVEPELECDVAALAMAYLGDRAPSELVGTGWWRACDGAAIARADTLFGTAAVPWCGTFF